MDKKLFELINSYEAPEVITDIAIYAHGYKHVEIAFFLFCLILGAVLLGSPKKGIRAAIAVFITSISSFLVAKYLIGATSRPFPYLDENLSSKLRVELLASLSAFPLVSVVLFSAVATALVYYFPKYSTFVIIASIVYTLLPIHLGVAFPSDAFGSLILGSVFSYFVMAVLTKKAYFRRY